MFKIEKNINLPPPRVIILGASETGKSTLLTHVEWERGDTEKLRRAWYFVPVVLILPSLSCLITTAERQFHYVINPAYKTTINVAESVLNQPGEVPAHIVQGLKAIWNDPLIQRTFTQRRESPFYLHNEAIDYYMDKLDEMIAPQYIPTLDDILRIRVRTTGIREMLSPITPADVQVARSRYPPRCSSLSFSNLNAPRISVLDFAGRRSERRKWIHAFEDVDELVFCISLSEYVLPLFEDVTTNRAHESLTLLNEIMHSRWFTYTPMILLFTKVDIFRKQLPFNNLQKTFPDYYGYNEYQEALDFIIGKFVQASGRKDGEVHIVVADLLDVSTIKDVVSFIKGNALYSYFTKKQKPPTVEKNKKK